jgi:hypothetical protein
MVNSVVGKYLPAEAHQEDMDPHHIGESLLL